MQRGKNRLPYLIIAGAVLIVASAMIIHPPVFIQFMENKTFDFRFLLRGERPIGNEIVIVAIDETSIAKIGRWPWPREKMAELIAGVAKDGAKTIGVDILFSEPETDRGHTVTKDILQTYQREHHSSNGFLSYLKNKEAETSGDAKLTKAVADAENVILPFAMQVPLSGENNQAANVPEDLFFYPFMVVKEQPFSRPVVGNGALLPIEPLRNAAWSLGSAYSQYDRDGAIRWEPLSIKLDQYYFPDFALEVARHYLGLAREDVQLVAGEGIVMGNHVIATDASGRALINYAGKGHTFPTISALHVLDRTLQASELRGKIVLIGTTALGTSDTHITPFAQLPGIEKQASVIENIIHRRFFTKEELIKLLDCSFVFLFCLVAVVLLPRLKALGGAILATGFALVYLLATQYLFVYFRWWVDLLVPIGSVFLLYSAMTAYRFLTEERRAREIKSMFSRYTTEKVVNELLAHPELAKLGGTRREVTVLFSDVRSFTTYSEHHTPEEVVSILNELLTAMTDVIMHWDGTLDKFVGDEIMAFWGAPGDQKNHAELATQCSLHMLQRLRELQRKWQMEGKEILDIGIGLNTGEVIVGNIGSETKKLDYTIIGDAVNLGARVEALTRNYNVHFMMTEYTLQKIEHLLPIQGQKPVAGSLGHIQVTRLDEVTVKGKTKPVVVYEVTDTELNK